MSLWNAVDAILLIALIGVLARLFMAGNHLKELTRNTEYERPADKVLKSILLASLVLVLLLISYAVFQGTGR